MAIIIEQTENRQSFDVKIGDAVTGGEITNTDDGVFKFKPENYGYYYYSASDLREIADTLDDLNK